MIGLRTSAEPSVVRRAAEMWPEGVEQMPYATSWKPLYPFPGSPVTGGALGSATTSVAAQVPTTCDLEFVRGDTVSFSFFFPGVCWTTTEPLSTLPPGMVWEEHVWNAQIRDPDKHPVDPCSYYCGGSWIPVWGGLPTNGQLERVSQMTLLTEFMCTATFVEPDEIDVEAQYDTYGTLVTIELDNTVTGSGSLIYPDDGYRWDLQTGTEYEFDPGTEDIIHVFDPRTVLQGAVTVHADYTYAETVVSL